MPGFVHAGMIQNFIIRIRQITGDLWFSLTKTSAWKILSSRFLIVTLLSSGVTSCLKDNFEFDKIKNGGITPQLAIPLAHSTLSIENLMKSESDSGNLLIDSNSFCTLIYSGRAMEVSSNTLIDLPVQSFNSQIQLTPAMADLINTQGHLAVSFEKTEDLNFPNQIELDSMTFKNGQMWLNLNMRIPASVKLTITIPSATLNEVPYSSQLVFNYTGSLPVTQNLAVNLENYRLDLSDNGTSKNRIRVKYDLEITHTGTNVTANHKLNLNCNINGFNFNSIYGYFGQQSFMSDYDTINISLFNNLDAFSNFDIASPEILISINNSIGVPIRAHVANMQGANGNFSNLIAAHGFPNPLPVLSPLFSQFGQTLTGTFSMNSLNSNVRPLIAAKPKYLLTQIQSLINPDGRTGLNFMTDSSLVSIDVEVKLPLYGTASGFILRDTVDFNNQQLKNIRQMTIRSFITNGFPFEADWQVYFADQNYLPLDSLVTTGSLFMPSATVNQLTGKVIAPSSQVSDNSLDDARISRIMHAKYLLIKAKASTYQNGNVNVKIYSDYSFTVQLGVIAIVNL